MRDGKDGRRGTYDKERRAPVATDDGDILATTTTTRRTRSAAPLIAVVTSRLPAAASSRPVAVSCFPVQRTATSRHTEKRRVSRAGESLG